MSLASIEPYDPTRVRTAGTRALVIGASMAGLLAARVLADAFEQVTIVDRDPLDPETGARRGVPQGQHTHVLLMAGQAVIEDLVPGLSDDLADSGAVVLDLSREVDVHAAGGFIAPGYDGMTMVYVGRPLLERLLRKRVVDHDRVALWAGCQVVEPVASRRSDAIEGVELLEDGMRHTVESDLVVDATGRRSRASTWLEQLGHDAPDTDTVRVDLVYRTCQVTRPTDDRRAVLVMPSAPRTRGAAVAPVEDDRWLVTLFGLHGDHPPSDLDGLRDFAAGLPVTDVADILHEHPLATPDIATYRFPSSEWHRYDQLGAHPRGLLCVGDAVASFNPIYGQGMSVAALEALSLHHVLAEGGRDALAQRYYARAGGFVTDAWNISAGGDFQFPQTEGPKPFGADLTNRYVTRLHRKARTDSDLADAFARVVTMERPPASMFRPSVAWRVLRPGGAPPRSTAPAG